MLSSLQGLSRALNGRWWSLTLLSSLLVLALATVLLAACVSAEPTPTPVFTPLPNLTSTIAPTLTPTTVPTLAPTETPVVPMATPTRMPTPTVPPTSTPEPTPEPTATPLPTPEPTATSMPPPTPTPTPTPQPQVHHPRELFLEVESKDVTGAAGAQVLNITGRSSPDATVSVNGQIAVVDETGAFEMSQPLKLDEGPNLVEVIASDLAGRLRSHIFTTISDPVNTGLSGSVTGIANPALGLTVITLDAGPEGVQRVQAVETTAG